MKWRNGSVKGANLPFLFFISFSQMKRILVFLLAIGLGVAAFSKDGHNEARQVFEEVYNKVFGPDGCTLHYNVNLVGIYKTNGTIWYKGKKSKFEDAKMIQWNDGQTAYALYKKKKTIEVLDVKSGNHDKYGSKFKFTLDDFDYSMEQQGDEIVITLKQHRGAKGTVKQAKAVLDARTRTPKMAKVKVALFWAHINISQFKAGGISDDVFVFPRDRYRQGFKYVDKR
jgi:hypothetical protein